MPDIILPSIHLNGSGKDSLLDEACEAMRAVANAIEKLPRPNGRDYYPQGDAALTKAIEQVRDWHNRLMAVHHEIEAYAVGIDRGGFSV